MTAPSVQSDVRFKLSEEKNRLLMLRKGEVDRGEGGGQRTEKGEQRSFKTNPTGDGTGVVCAIPHLRSPELTRELELR
jgi:hypothetical protein